MFPGPGQGRIQSAQRRPRAKPAAANATTGRRTVRCLLLGFIAFGEASKSRGDTIRTCDLYVPNVAL